VNKVKIQARLSPDTEIQADRTAESAVSQRDPLCARSCDETDSDGVERDGVERLGNMFSLTSKKYQQLMKFEEQS
jgi:hypothetical protein